MPNRWFPAWRLTPATGIPLRVALIVPFFLLVIGMAGLKGCISHETEHSAIEDLTDQLLRETGQRIEQNLANYLGTARYLAETNVAALRLGLLDARNPSLLETYFFQQLLAFPTINAVMLTNEQKDFVAAVRREQGLWVRVYNGAQRDGLHNYRVDAEGHRQELTWLDTQFDPHDDPPGDPWYASVKNAGKPHWRLVVGEIEADQPFLILAYMTPFDDSRGELAGITAVSLYLTRVGDFLRGLRIGQTGQAFVVDRDGLLIATSTGELPFKRHVASNKADMLQPEKQRLSATDSQNPLTRAASRYLNDTTGGFQRLTDARLFNITLNDQAHFLRIVPFSDDNLDWRIVVVVPEADVMGGIDATGHQMKALNGVVLILILLLGLWITRSITRPILALNADTGRLARGDFLDSSTTSPTASSITELRQLTDAFKLMRTRLRESFDALHGLNQALANHQEHLEEIIAQRTTSLRIYQQIVDSAPDALSLVGTDYHYKIINNTYLRRTGLTSDQIVDHPLVAIMGQAVFDEIIKPHLDACLAGDTIHYSEWFDFPLQGRRCMDVTYYPCHDRNHSIIGAVVISRDITEHRQMEEMLRELNQHLEQRVMERTADLTQAMALLNQEMQARQQGEERLTQALRAARAGAWEWNATTNEAIWSDGNYRVLGLTPGSVEARYENWLRCLHPEDRAEADRQVAQSMAQSGELNIEFRVVWPDGGIHWLNDIGQMRYDSAGQPVGMYGIQIDITERKRAEEALRGSEAFRQRVFNSSRIPIVVMDRVTGKFIDCNPAAVEIYRYSSREETLGKTPLDISAPVQYDGTPSPEKARFYIEKALAEGGIVFEWRHQRSSGEVWDAEVHLMGFQSDRGELLQFTLQDITARKQAEIALLETMRLLEREVQARSDQEVQLLQARKLEAVGRLTGGIAHDFNNLLTVIKGNLEILRGQGGDWIEPDQALLIEDALSAARQGAELTVGLLAFSRQQPLRAQRTRVYRIVQALERLLERVLGPAIILRVEIDPTLPDVMADPGQLQAALMNLMLNAQDAMPEGGTLDVRTATVDVRRGTAAPVANLAPGRYVVVTVADSGIGMDADTLARACEPFFTTKPIGKGTGLGLSTVYGFAAQSHGGIAIESQPGQGTTVRLFLPALDPSSVRTARVAQALPSPPRGTETILVVEDHARVRRLACRYLHDLGYTVVEATNAEEAIAILETEPDIQMVFSDIVMPGGLDGYDLANWIATHRPTVKCLLATGYHDQARAAPTGDSPLPPVLAKPYSREQLAHQLRQLLDGEAGTSTPPLP